MQLRKNRRRALLCLNFMFVTWGILFLLGLTHGIFRRELQSPTSLKIIFMLASTLHLIAVLLGFSAVYNVTALAFRLLAANFRANRRIKKLRESGERITDDSKRSIRLEEYGEREELEQVS